jgi:hypothetical protein
MKLKYSSSRFILSKVACNPEFSIERRGYWDLQLQFPTWCVDQFNYYPPIEGQVSTVVSSVPVFRPQFCIHFTSLSCVLHTLLISSSFYSTQITYSFTNQKTDEHLYFRLHNVLYLFPLLSSCTWHLYSTQTKGQLLKEANASSLLLARRERVSHYLVVLSPTFHIICLSIEFNGIIMRTVPF